MNTTRTTRMIRRPAWIGALAGLALFGAACGDDSTLDADPAEIEADIEDLGEDVEVPTEDEAEDAQVNLVDALESVGLGSLASAVGDIDVSELTDAAEFTFFAPNDEAFTALSADDLADLLADVDELDDVLRNHVVPERIDAATLVTLESVTTEAGNELAVVVDGDTVTVGGATVVTTDVEAGDGVVHAIDAVLIEE